jgi:hypothetical protein
VTLLVAVIIAIAVTITINGAEAAGMNVSPQHGPDVGDDPGSQPPRPRSRGPPAPGDGNVPDDENPRPGKPSLIRPRPAPSAHNQVPAHPTNPSPSGHATPEITPTNNPIM